MKITKILSLILAFTIALTVVGFSASAENQTYLRGDTDFNGKITSADLLNIQLVLLNQKVMVGNEEQAVDANGDRFINSTDALVMLQQLVGISNCVAQYTPKFWSAVPMVSKAQYDAGIYGGEGCQWPLFITFSETDSNIAYMGTDVGGMYRSEDGGITWAQASIGIGSSGVSCIKTDPNNVNRVIIQGVNSTANKHNGLYLSTDSGKTYKPVNTVSIVGHRDFRDCIAFDAGSYSASVGGSAIVYWLQENGTLYKSTDGGETWSAIITENSNYVYGDIFVHPTNGYVYIASSTGFYRSTDKGGSFTQISTENFNGMDVINTQPNNVYLSSNNGIYISTDSGASVSKIEATGLPTYPTRIEVSPVNPNYMVVDNDLRANTGSYNNSSYYSHDGGKTWTESTRDTSNSVIAYNGRNDVHAWSPADANICLSLGGDMILRSTNACKKFVWSNSGYNGAAVTDISYNLNNPALMISTNQDYSGFYSTDYGRTWTYVKAWNEQGWGGYAYGSYPVTETIFVALKSKSRNLYYTTDGGKTGINTGLASAYSTYSCVTGVKGDNNIVFANEFRSADQGKTWTTMTGCVAVFGGNENKIYGVNADKRIVVSSDKGVSWSVFSSYSNGVEDMCFDALANRLLIIDASQTCLYQVDCSSSAVSVIKDYSTATDSFTGVFRLRTVEVDPKDSNIIYLGNARQIYASEIGVLKSVNNGNSFTNITSTRNNVRYGDDGGRQITVMCINPATRHLYAGGGCRGIYKVALDQ